MERARDAVRALAARQGSAFAVEQALAHGMTRRQVHGAVRLGEWVRRANGLLVVAGVPPSWHQDLWLAHLAAGPSSVVSGRAAAQRHGFSRYRRNCIEVMVPHDGNHRAIVGRVRGTRWLPREHVVDIDGLPTTSVELTIMHLAGDPDHPWTFRNEAMYLAHKRHMNKVIDDALRRRGLTMPRLMRMLVVMARRGRAGGPMIRELITELGEDYEPTETELEGVVLELLRSEGIELPDQQVDVSDETGWLARVDFLYRKLKLIIEVDGPDHDSPLRRKQDRERDRALRAAGYVVVRIHWTELYGDPDAVLRKLLDAITAAA